MNYRMIIMMTMLFYVTTDLHSMSRYQGSDFFNNIKRYLFPISIEQIQAINDEEKNVELSCQAFAIYREWELRNSKPTGNDLDNIIKFVKCGASADSQIYVRTQATEKMFTPLYLTLLANSIGHAQILLEKGARTDIVWSSSTIAKTDLLVYYSALKAADMWCNDSGEMKDLIRKYEMKRKKEIMS